MCKNGEVGGVKVELTERTLVMFLDLLCDLDVRKNVEDGKFRNQVEWVKFITEASWHCFSKIAIEEREDWRLTKEFNEEWGVHDE